MLMLLKDVIKDKRILILGFGREGKSTYRRIRQAGGYASLAVADMAGARFLDPAVEILSGDNYMDTLDDYDLVFKSPGIVLPKDPSAYTCQITSQMQIFFEAYRDRIIGVTGTKGKSTTTTLLHHILKESGRDAVLCGNIGIPAFDILEEIHPESLLVCELSCHQLEYIRMSPHIGVLLNIHEEHLDHYGTMEKYIHSKQQIYLHQKEGDLLFCSMDVLPEKGACKSRVYAFSDQSDDADIFLENKCVKFENNTYSIPEEQIHLIGHHNHIDIAFDYAVCKVLGLSDEEFDRALQSYEPLPHRLNYVGTREGVRYYDDSISTICDTTIQALKSIHKPGTVLIGGMDRGIDYSDLIRYLSVCPVPHIILMAATGKRIYEEIRQRYPDFRSPERLILLETLEEAVEKAKDITQKGDACILSPAAASYGIFKNFEERGDVFKELVFQD